MLKLLLKKEWLENFRFNIKKSVKSPISTLISSVIMIGLIACLLYVFVLLNQRFVYYDVSLPLFTIALFIFVVVQMVIHLGKFSKMVFNSSDKQIVNPLPIPKRTLVLSKLIIFYFEPQRVLLEPFRLPPTTRRSLSVVATSRAMSISLVTTVR